MALKLIILISSDIINLIAHYLNWTELDDITESMMALTEKCSVYYCPFPSSTHCFPV